MEELSKILEGKTGKLHAVKCDVSNKDDVIKTFKWIKDNLGPVSILINNAGLYKHGTIMGEFCLVIVKWFFLISFHNLLKPTCAYTVCRGKSGRLEICSGYECIWCDRMFTTGNATDAGT